MPLRDSGLSEAVEFIAGHMKATANDDRTGHAWQTVRKFCDGTAVPVPPPPRPLVMSREQRDTMLQSLQFVEDRLVKVGMILLDNDESLDGKRDEFAQKWEQLRTICALKALEEIPDPPIEEDPPGSKYDDFGEMVDTRIQDLEESLQVVEVELSTLSRVYGELYGCFPESRRSVHPNTLKGNIEYHFERVAELARIGNDKVHRKP